jgi:5-phospho-D-xylono-1,4-lactonase
VLGLDLGSRDYLRAYEGGPGLRYLMAMFVPRLRRRIGDEATARILVANPARLYAMGPRVDPAGASGTD